MGIRKYLGASIDLWQGEASQFVCDFLYILDFSADLQASVVSSLEKAESSHSRHVTVAVVPASFGTFTPKIIAEACILAARKFLEIRLKHDDSVSKNVRRITFALGDGSTYEVFQQALFREFPEELL